MISKQAANIHRIWMQVNGSHALVSPCSLLKTHICNWLVGQLRPVRVRNQLNQCLLYHLARGQTTSELKGLYITYKELYAFAQLYSTFFFWPRPTHTIWKHNFSNIRTIYIYSLVVKSVGSGVKLPQFEFQLHNLQPILSNTSQFPQPYNRNNNIIYHIWLLRGLNETTHV